MIRTTASLLEMKLPANHNKLVGSLFYQVQIKMACAMEQRQETHPMPSVLSASLDDSFGDRVLRTGGVRSALPGAVERGRVRFEEGLISVSTKRGEIQFCAERKPPAWQPPAREVRELQALVRRLESLMEMHQMEVNRLEAGVAAELVRESLAEHIAFLDEEIKRTTALIRQHIDQHPTLREQRELLVSIPGIGDTTAARLLAKMLDVKLYQSARQLAAFAGLVPRLHESGNSIKRKARLSKTGAPRLRKALYFPAIAAIKYNPYIKAMSLRLKERGLCPVQIIGAAMRKLVHLAYGVLKSGKPFDPALVKTA